MSSIESSKLCEDKEMEMETLPVGWKRVRLSDKNYFKIVGSGIDYYKGSKYYLSTTSIQGTKIVNIEDVISFKDRPSRANMQPKKGRLTFAKMRDTIKVLLIDEKLEEDYILSTGFAIFETIEDPKFVYQYLLSRFFNNQKDIFAEGTTQEAISNDDFEKIYINLPPLPEQQKISEILETVDNAIEKNDKIIEKYKRIKQGLMQDLLTRGIDENGQIRSEVTHRFKDSLLGRIPEEWEVVKLGGIGKIIYGERLSSEDYDIHGDSKVYGTGGIINFSRKFIDEGEAIIFPRKGTINNKFYVNDKEKFWVIDTAFYFKTFKIKQKTKFLFYKLETINFNLLNEATGVPSLNRNTLEQIKIAIPKSKSEQQRIASILSQVDEIIEKEENYKEKLGRIKQGLMEDLLTGKVRVNHLIEKTNEE